MKYVLDASVGVKWVIPEIHSDKALYLRDEFRNGIISLIAPAFYPFEVGHSITRAERQGRITPAQGALALRDTLNHLPRLEQVLSLAGRAYAISSQRRAGFYDCLYVALAEQEGCELVTADDKLLKNLGPYFPLIVSLAALPSPPPTPPSAPPTP